MSEPASSGGDATGIAPELPMQVELRAEVDLRPAFQKFGLYLKDQGRRPSCSVFALVGALEYETARTYGNVEPLSEEFLIWAVHELQPGIATDNGYHFAEVVSALQTYGVPRQSIMRNTFGRKISDIHPSPEALFDASARKIAVPVWFRPDDPQLIARVVDSLNHETPVVVGLRWPQWQSFAHTNLLRQQRPLNGPGHAVTLVGYRCPSGNPADLLFIFRNSYGVDWGLAGYAFVAASYLHDNVLAAFYVTLPRTSAAVAAH